MPVQNPAGESVISEERISSRRMGQDYMQDSFGRKIEYLRVSVTDKCNLRCRYCMPQEGITRLAHDDILRLEEWARIIRIMQELGITKVRFTGGEPLVRKNLIQLIKDVHALDGISQIAMTTNGILLGEQAADLREAGLTHVNISLDTLNPRTFEEITRVRCAESSTFFH